jgi:AcrR family transcriptional regulator
MPANQRDLQRAATREQLFTAAIALFDQRGYDAVSIDDIVQKAAVARGTFYFHFPKKDDVLIELIRRSDRHIVARMAAIKRGRPLRTALRATTDAFAEVWRDRRALLPHAGAVALRRIAMVAAERDQQPLRLELVKHVEAALAAGELRSRIPAQMLADVFLLNVFAALMAWASTGVPPLDVIMPAVIDLFLHGASGT